MQGNSWYHTLFQFHFSFWIWKVWKGREKNTKIWISGEEKSIFYNFWRVIIWWISKKIVDTSFNLVSKWKRSFRKGHASIFGFDCWEFKLVPVDSTLNFASENLTHLYHKSGHGTEKSSQTWKSRLDFFWNVVWHQQRQNWEVVRPNFLHDQEGRIDGSSIGYVWFWF